MRTTSDCNHKAFVRIVLSLFALFYPVVVFSQSSAVKIIELNRHDEYVLIKNEGDAPVNLKGWVLHDHDYGKAAVYSYTFEDLKLQANEILQMQSGEKKGNADEDRKTYKLASAHAYIHWSDRKVWNDTCDIAYLQDAQGNLIDKKGKGNGEPCR
jgi:hypothetical protein